MDQSKTGNRKAWAQLWQRDVKANMAIILAIILVPLAAVIGLAIDSARKVTAVRHVQLALDAASLAALRALQDAENTDADVRTIGLSVFQANLETSQDDLECDDPSVNIDRTNLSVRVQAACQFDAMIGGGITGDNVRFNDVAQAKARALKLDVALMLDVSGSMDGEKLDFLKDGAKETVRTLVGGNTDDRVRVALVSFDTAVNAGPLGNAAQGLPETADEYNNGLDKVCVTERTGAEEYTDEEPGPFQWVGNLSPMCPDTSVVPLTSNLSTLNASIDSLVAVGSTAGQIAVAWSWYLISPKWADFLPASSRPRPYDGDTLKVVVLMTDGLFNLVYSANTSVGMATRLCDAMRASDVIVYAIAFDAPSDAQWVLKTCTGNVEERYYEAETGEDLLEAYSSIARELTALALAE